jgi:hypothetical protein
MKKKLTTDFSPPPKMKRKGKRKFTRIELLQLEKNKKGKKKILPLLNIEKKRGFTIAELSPEPIMRKKIKRTSPPKQPNVTKTRFIIEDIPSPPKHTSNSPPKHSSNSPPKHPSNSPPKHPSNSPPKHPKLTNNKFTIEDVPSPPKHTKLTNIRFIIEDIPSPPKQPSNSPPKQPSNSPPRQPSNSPPRQPSNSPPRRISGLDPSAIVNPYCSCNGNCDWCQLHRLLENSAQQKGNGKRNIIYKIRKRKRK